MLDTRAMRGADVYSDHYLVRTKIRLKLARKENKAQQRMKFDVYKLQNDEVRKRYQEDVRRRFGALGDAGSIEEEHANFLEVYKESAKAILGRTKKQNKPWIGDETWRE